MTAATLTLLAVGCAGQPVQVPPSATRLDSAALRAMFVDMTASGISVTSGQPYSSYYAPDGTVRLESGTSFRAAGQYRITEDGRLCSAYQSMRGGQENCSSFFRDGSKVFRVADDGRVYEFKEQFRQGNPDRL
jgi:hypothetical protein